MKLVYCVVCDDSVVLRMEERMCRCGKSKGKYREDGLTADISGPCVTLGFSSPEFSEAVRKQILLGDKGLQPLRGTDQLAGRTFLAFVIPDSASTVVREGNERPPMPELIKARDAWLDNDRK
ncbi:hypothetical protein ACYPKM_03875 [Pseudomonas aeruginosa]